jgi:hypothetical protein
MKGLGWRVIAVSVAIVIVAVAIVLYVSKLLSQPTPVAVGKTAPRTANLTLATTAAAGTASLNRPWVTYLVKNKSGQWVHSTVFKVPAHSLVHVTVYQYDGDSGLRNPFLSQVQGTVGSRMEIDGKPRTSINPDTASHTFAVPQLGILVPLKGVPDSAKNPCDEWPCTTKQDHETVTFTIKTGKPGRYRWQCFVPCAAGFIDGFGGPMQTLGYMDGFLQVT